MISPATVQAAISIARGLIKLGRRLDLLLAEKEAVSAGRCVLPMPPVAKVPPTPQMQEDLEEFLKDDAALANPDLPANFKKRVQDTVNGPDVSQEEVFAVYRLACPERAVLIKIEPDAEFVRNLRTAWPTLDLDDPDTLTALFHVAAGQDPKRFSYGLRVGLLVADVLAEVAGENLGLVVRDANLEQIVGSVLQRFSKPDLETFTEWSPLLRHALGATVNGVMDARAAIAGDSEWLAAVLDALADARAQAEDGEHFVIGLLEGRGYGLLLGTGIARAAEALAEDQAGNFRVLVSDVLKAAAPLVKESRGFKDFFSEHWGDLLHAGLLSLEREGPTLLAGSDELLKQTLLAAVGHLKDIDRRNLFTTDTLVGIVDAAIAAVAAKPSLLKHKVEGSPWLLRLLESVIESVKPAGVRRAFSLEGLAGIIRGATGTLAQHPELIAERPGLLQEVVGKVLKAVSELGSFDAQNLATAVVQGGLKAVADRPDLLETRYPDLLGDFAARLAALVKERTITGADASSVASAAVGTMLQNPPLFGKTKGNLAAGILDAVLKAADNDPSGLLAGSTLVAAFNEVLVTVAVHGRDVASSKPLAEFVEAMSQLLTHGLARAERELGRSVDLRGVPRLLANLVAAWLRGGGAPLDPNSPVFESVFAAGPAH